MAYYKAQNQNEEKRLICRVMLDDIENWNQDTFSISNLEFVTGRSPATIRHIIDVEMPKRGYEFSYEADPDMCTPDLDEEIQIPDQHIRIYACLVKGA